MFLTSLSCQASPDEETKKSSVSETKLTGRSLVALLDKNSDGKLSKKECDTDLKLFFSDLDSNQDGFLDTKEADVAARFENRRLSGEVEAKEQEPSGGLTVAQLFLGLDKNRDNLIQKDEANAQLKPYFEQYDLNKDKGIDRKEARILVEHANAAMQQQNALNPKKSSSSNRVTAKQLIAFLDRNNDQKIAKDEANAQLKAGFALFDKNKDGFIDLKEAGPLAEVANQATGKSR